MRRILSQKALRRALIIRPMPFVRLIAGVVLALAASACTPALNWRAVTLPGSSASALLPCKADRTTRSVPLGGAETELAMLGCRGAGMTFAIMAARLPDAGRANEVLAGWQQATLANMQADAASVERADYRPAGGLALPHAQRLSALGRAADGTAVVAQAVWSARATDDGGAELLHAVVYAERPQPDAADAFFDGIHW